MTAPEFSPEFCERLDDLFIWRRDVRHFETRALDEGLVDILLDRACLAPSVGNSQPWRFVRVLSAERRGAIIAHVEAENARAAAAYDDETRAAYSALKPHGLREAPEHIAVFCEAEPQEGKGLGRQTMPETLVYSTVLAIHTLWLAARARGVGLGWVGFPFLIPIPSRAFWTCHTTGHLSAISALVILKRCMTCPSSSGANGKRVLAQRQQGFCDNANA